MSLDPLLLDLLACPIDKQALLYLPDEGILYNPRLRRSYQVRDGIPVLLADRGTTVTDEQHLDLLRRAGAAPDGTTATLRVPLDDLLHDHVPGPRPAGRTAQHAADRVAEHAAERSADHTAERAAEDAASA